MKKQFASLLMVIFLIQSHLSAWDIELNTSYDYFRGLPEGDWNGNEGVYFSGNLGEILFDCVGLQVAGSYGLYNWDGRENFASQNSKRLEQEAFLTAGLFSSFGQFNGGVVYDRLFGRHLGIYDVNPSFDQIRFQTGYLFCCEEIGVWGTARLSTSHKTSAGIPVSFRAINQINAFWTHFFGEFAKTTIWAGAPYGNSLRYGHKPAGLFTVGFSVRAPLTDCLFVDGHGAYMRARKASGSNQSRNYDSNVCVGITYIFGGKCSNYGASYMPVANNSNFLIDTNVNQ